MSVFDVCWMMVPSAKEMAKSALEKLRKSRDEEYTTSMVFTEKTAPLLESKAMFPIGRSSQEMYVNIPVCQTIPDLVLNQTDVSMVVCVRSFCVCAVVHMLLWVLSRLLQPQ
jgi:hypothetical protein